MVVYISVSTVVYTTLFDIELSVMVRKMMLVAEHEGDGGTERLARAHDRLGSPGRPRIVTGKL